MTNKSPIFPIHEPQHFSDYGFDSQIDYFQVLEEARKHKRETSSTRSTIENLHFKLQKPISRDDTSKKIKKTRKRWWKNAFRFFKRKHTSDNTYNNQNCGYGSFPGPVYLAESRSETSTPYHRTSTSRSSFGQLAGRGAFGGIPYINLSEFNMDQTHKMSTSPMPIYLVT